MGETWLPITALFCHTYDLSLEPLSMAFLISVNSQTQAVQHGVCGGSLTSAALDPLHLIHKPSPSLSCLLLLHQKSLLTPHALSSSCCLLHPKTLSHGLAELRLLAHFGLCCPRDTVCE